MTETSLNPAQQQMVDCGLLTSGFSCVLQMPTGSGKTWLAKKAIRHSVQRGLRALYLTPLRALAEELLSDWTKEFTGFKVGVFTGDYGRGGVAFPTPYRDARVLIMTPGTVGCVYADVAFALELDPGGGPGCCGRGTPLERPRTRGSS
jgi:helicase